MVAIESPTIRSSGLGAVYKVVQKLTLEVRKTVFTDSKKFENRVRSVLVELGSEFTKNLSLEPPAQVFPDIVIFRGHYKPFRMKCWKRRDAYLLIIICGTILTHSRNTLVHTRTL